MVNNWKALPVSVLFGEYSVCLFNLRVNYLKNKCYCFMLTVLF